MATVESDVEQTFLEWVERAIAGTAILFLKNPWQFHGDTGIMHYLYHRILSLGGEDLFHRAEPGGTVTLLLESEHYTKERYVDRGERESPGKLDFALLDPGSITREGRVRRGKGSLPAIAGIEVGLEKPVEKMGDMSAEAIAQSVRPGDAAKLIRGIRFGSLRHGFLLEFYRGPAAAGVARRVYDAVLAAADGLASFHVLVLVAGNSDTPPKASVYPNEWKSRLGLDDYGEIGIEAAEKQDADLSTIERFRKHCGRGNLLLQARLKELETDYPRAVKLWLSRALSPKSMTVRRAGDRHGLARITTRLDAPQELRQIDPAFARALTQAGLTLVDDRLGIPDEEDADFVSRVVSALKTALGLPSVDERPSHPRTEPTLWDSLERLTGIIEAPRDWSDEHDHYLYGLPKRQEDRGE